MKLSNRHRRQRNSIAFGHPRRNFVVTMHSRSILPLLKALETGHPGGTRSLAQSNMEASREAADEYTAFRLADAEVIEIGSGNVPR
ncbi:hypothetical protein PSP6_540066 [Paraburkholderia tropica]|uniref:hypothetical protein n=1 Tax=Paraburkholderia tropica TaxID=92647 RepID=UPI001CACE5ED|nr:hypothetical protein [Paraburkholderia tropica]CAG9230178.1 hypothetical protein PSP6_540066 [Paraburkholderia tropica]